jgi:hypothetical protein
MATLDEQIAQALNESLRNGELKSAPSFGKPLDLGDGYAATPDEWRMPFKVLKDAGMVPPEIETMRQLAALRTTLEACRDEAEAHRLRQRIVELQQHLALRLERLSRHGGL